MEEVSYQKQMRQYIDLVKKMAFEAPLEQTLEDLKTMAKGTQELADRIDARVKQSLGRDKDASKKPSTSKKKPTKVKPFKSITPIPKPKPLQPQTNKSFPTTNQPNATAFTQGDINKIGQQSLTPIKPQPPIGSD